MAESLSTESRVWRTTDGTRSTDYKFGYAELYVGRGVDEGMLIPAARVRLRDGDVEVELSGSGFGARSMD